MFDIKLVAIILLIAAIGGGVWEWHAKNERIETLVIASAQKEVVIGALTDTLVKNVDSNKITEATNTLVSISNAAVEKKQQTIVDSVASKIAKIDYSYKATPPTLASSEQHDTAISNELITGLWDEYCSGQPDAVECTKKIN